MGGNSNRTVSSQEERQTRGDNGGRAALLQPRANTPGCTGTSRRQGAWKVSLQSCRGRTALSTPCSRNPGLLSRREHISVVLTPPICGLSLRWSKETSTGTNLPKMPPGHHAWPTPVCCAHLPPHRDACHTLSRAAVPGRRGPPRTRVGRRPGGTVAGCRGWGALAWGSVSVEGTVLWTPGG